MNDFHADQYAEGGGPGRPPELGIKPKAILTQARKKAFLTEASGSSAWDAERGFARRGASDRQSLGKIIEN